jgi:hypothetical protein
MGTFKSMKTLSEIGRQMVDQLNWSKKGVTDARFSKSLLSWLMVQDGWVTPVWTHLTNYSGEKDVVRFRNDMVTNLPKSQWNHQLPDQYHFEMTAMISECTDELLNAVIDYCELARRQPKCGFDRHPPEFPCGPGNGSYGWTQLAWETMNERLRARG